MCKLWDKLEFYAINYRSEIPNLLICELILSE